MATITNDHDEKHNAFDDAMGAEPRRPASTAIMTSTHFRNRADRLVLKVSTIAEALDADWP